MLTGTPLDLTPFGSILTGIGLLYWLLAGAGLWWALRGPRPWHLRLLRALPVLLLFGFFPARTAWESYQWQQRSRAALAHFEMRCKSAGEKISRTVDNVEGVVWMKWRDKALPSDDADQFKLFDPYGRDCTEQGCIEQLLRLHAEPGRFQREVDLTKARYGFVESTDPTDGKLYRYTGTMKLPSPPWTPEAIERQQRQDGRAIGDDSYRFALERKPISKRTARYGVTWDDISTREDREHWIAGGSIKVIDLQTNEVIAERVGYMMDRGLGSTAGFRSPWGYALRNACPGFPTDGTHTTRSWPRTETLIFVSKALQPITGK
jgi:hypothetical protein